MSNKKDLATPNKELLLNRKTLNIRSALEMDFVYNNKSNFY